MRKNLKQSGELNAEGAFYIINDWYKGVIPSNVRFGKDVYIDSSYGFIMFHSEEKPAMAMGRASASYDQAMFVTSKKGRIDIGKFSILNGTTLICSNHISIGNFVMLAWGSVITDNLLGSDLNMHERGRIMEQIAGSGMREMPFTGSSPVYIADNVWVGFDTVILPGTIIGRGSVIGSKSVISGNIPPYSVVAGNPGRMIKKLEPRDHNWHSDPGGLT